LFIMFLLLGKPAWIAWKQFLRYPKPERYLSLVLFVNLIVFYVEMWGVAVYGWGQNGYMLWTMIALIFAYPRCRETEALQKHGEENPLLAMDADSDLEPAWPVEDRPRSNA
ncbi:MAG TPA: hypothetical protein VNN17_12325, partial [Terriglobia bacterium]|nr:hypothetical protein [Terriglobia bacterium]